MTSGVHIYPTAEDSPHAEIGAGTRIWHHAQVREGARLGSDCIVGKGAHIDFGIEIGSHAKIQNHALVYHEATVEDDALIGLRLCLTNEKGPRAITPSGALRRAADWRVGCIVVFNGASRGAGAIVLPGVTIRRFAMVGEGVVGKHDMPDSGLVIGQPARLIGYVCRCGQRLVCAADGTLWCSTCRERYDLIGGET